MRASRIIRSNANIIRHSTQMAIKIAKSQNQQKYINFLQNDNIPIIIATGPAGCGKTLFACQEGILQFKNLKYNKIIITRPTIGVDEDYGYLPGDIDAKFDPWMQPIYDSFGLYYHPDKIKRLRSEGVIEIAPLAFMRGRTFENSWIIADEMQNSSPTQMKMLLTRIGNNSKLVITGDLDQKDTPLSGLEQFLDIYNDDLIYTKSLHLNSEDIVRHPAVAEIINLYNTIHL